VTRDSGRIVPAGEQGLDRRWGPLEGNSTPNSGPLAALACGSLLLTSATAVTTPAGAAGVWAVGIAVANLLPPPPANVTHVLVERGQGALIVGVVLHRRRASESARTPTVLGGIRGQLDECCSLTVSDGREHEMESRPSGLWEDCQRSAGGFDDRPGDG